MPKPKMLWPEDVADVLGVSTPTVYKMLAKARRAAEAGVTDERTHLPLPTDTERRKRWNGHHWLTVTSPRWSATTIRKFKANRPGVGAAGVPRPSRRKKPEPVQVGD